jgi:hypothetical protein
MKGFTTARTVVKENDDLMAATRYAIMMLRYATCIADDERSLMPRGQQHGKGGATQWMGS